MPPEFFGRRPRLMRALLEAFVPAAGSLDERDLHEVLRASDALIADRGPKMRFRLRLAAGVIRLLALGRFGRGLSRVAVEPRRRFLERLQDSPILNLRLAVWGLRTLLFGGYYADPARQAALGYRPQADGWDARRPRARP